MWRGDSFFWSGFLSGFAVAGRLFLPVGIPSGVFFSGATLSAGQGSFEGFLWRVGSFCWSGFSLGLWFRFDFRFGLGSGLGLV